jgi:hypothetical protein
MAQNESARETGPRSQPKAAASGFMKTPKDRKTAGDWHTISPTKLAAQIYQRYNVLSLVRLMCFPVRHGMKRTGYHHCQGYAERLPRELVRSHLAILMILA